MASENISSELQNLKIDTESTNNYCDDLINGSINLSSINQSLKYIVGTDIPTYFASDSADIQSIIEGLNENAEFLDNLIKFNKEFAMTLQDYATAVASVSEGSTGGSAGFPGSGSGNGGSSGGGAGGEGGGGGRR